MSETVASLLGGGAKINGDGSVQAPAYAALEVITHRDPLCPD
jgi:hypothetical protein